MSKDIDHQIIHGYNLLHNLQFEESVKWFNHLYNKFPERAEIRLGLGQSLTLVRRFREAVKHLSDAYRLGDDEIKYVSACEIVECYLKLYNYSFANEWLRKARTLFPGRVRAQELLAWLSFMQGDYESSERFSLMILEGYPGNAHALEILARIALQRNEPEKAKHILDQLLAIEPREGHFYVLKGDILRQSGNYQSALQSYKQSIQLNSFIIEAYIGISKCLVYINRFQDAIEIMEPLIYRYPDDYYVHYWLGWIYYRRRVYRKAIEIFYNSLEMNDQVGYTHFYLGRCYSWLGRFAKAAYHYEQSAVLFAEQMGTRNKDFIRGLMGVAVTSFLGFRWRRAWRFFRQAVVQTQQLSAKK